MHTVCLVGRAGSGKDTAAAALLEAFRCRRRRILRMAAPVKAAVQALFGVSEDDVNDNSIKDRPHPLCSACTPNGTPRDAMVWLTDAAKAHLGRDFFARRLFDSVTEEGVLTIIPDVRYSEDVQVARQHGAFVVKIVRPIENGGTAYEWEHTVDAIHADVVIVNDGSDVDAFRNSVIDKVTNMYLCYTCQV